MIPEELRNFIEQNCSGKDPSDLIMEAIGQKIEQLGADADEVLAFVDECAKGPTLEQKAAEIERKENERLAFIEHLEKRLAEVKSDDLDLYNTIKLDLEADIKKARSVYSSDSQVHKIVSALEEEKVIADEKLFKHKRNKKILRYALILLFIALFIGGYSLFSGKMTISAKPQTTNDSLMDLRQKFYSCKTWEDQLQYVIEPERVRPLMEAYYKKETYSSTVNLDNDVNIKRFQGKNHVIYKVNRNYIVQTDDGYKIDWEATMEFNPVSLLEMRNYPKKEFEYRGDFWQKNIGNFNCIYLGNQSCAYVVNQNSLIAKRLNELLPYGEGGSKELFLKIKYNGYSDINDYYWYHITEIISENYSKY